MQRIAWKYALRMLAGFILLFLVAHFTGLSHNYHLRILNGIIHLTFMWMAIKEYWQTHPDQLGNYVSGVAMGMYTAVPAVALFTFFMWVFLSLDVNRDFFEHLRSQAPLPEYFTPFTASLYIFAEGIAVSLIGSYVLARILETRMSGEKT